MSTAVSRRLRAPDALPRAALLVATHGRKARLDVSSAIPAERATPTALASYRARRPDVALARS